MILEHFCYRISH